MILESTMNDREVAVVDQIEERRVIWDIPGKSTSFRRSARNMLTAAVNSTTITCTVTSE